MIENVGSCAILKSANNLNINVGGPTMYYYSIFQQLFKFVPRYRFEKSVEKHSGDRYCKHFTAIRQLKTILYAQLAGKDSLREVESGLLMNANRMYHLDMEPVSRSTLSDAMNRRSPEIFRAMFEEILDRACACAPGHGFKFKNPLYAIDSTTIALSLTVYNWARYRKHKGAIKLHTQLDLSGNLPCYVLMTNGKMADVRTAKKNIKIVPDSIYTFDKGYYDLNWFRQIDEVGAFFVTRIKNNARFEVAGQHRPALPKKGVISDERIGYTGPASVKKYPGKLRLIEFMDDEGKTYQFLTNNFKLAASSIAEIYRQRWQIELFFKWIKQNLKIKSFLGTSKNAVMTQIWVALILYLLLSYIKFINKCRYGITELANRLRDTLMSDFALLEVLNLNRDTLKKPPDWNAPEQLDFFANCCNIF